VIMEMKHSNQGMVRRVGEMGECYDDEEAQGHHMVHTRWDLRATKRYRGL
jgi:hypothetical protein